MTGQTRDYIFRLRGDSDQLAQSAERAAQSVDRLADSTGSFLREQAAARAVGEAFVASLTRQAQTAGKTQSELLALRAAELGVADAARPLIAQIEAQAVAQEASTAAAQRAAAAQKALDNIRSAAQAQERQAYQSKQQFIDQLQREAEALGKTRSELLAQRAAQLGVTAQAAPLIQRLQAGERAFAGFARGGKLSGQELVQVGYQLNDFAVQVASGQNAIIALVQQGSQLSGTFGGVGNALRALRSLITPTTLAIGGLSAVVGGLAYVFAQGYKEQAAFESSLRLTGNRAGVTKGQIDEYARSIADSTDLTITASREALQAVVASGAFGPQAVQQVAQAAALLADRTGRTADDVVKDFARMRDGVARWAADANRSYNFLTVEQYKYIRTLEQQGKAEEAARETARLLGEQLGKKTPTELGYLGVALRENKKYWAEFWNAVFDIGRPATVDEKLNEAIDAAIAAQKRLEDLQANRPGFKGKINDAQAQFNAAKARVDALRAQRDADRKAAAEDAAAAKQNQDDIARLQKDYVDASISLQRAGEQRSAAVAELARTREYEANEEQYARLQIGFGQYLATRARLERAALNAKLASIDQELDAEKKRVIDKPDSAEAVQQQARLVEIETRRYQVLQERARLERQIRAEFGVDDTSTAGRIREAQAEADEEEARALNARREAAARTAGEIVESNRSISISLIRDAEQRGLALIEAERQQLKQRLDLFVLDAGDRKLAEDELAKYVVLRQRELTESLKPEWQRMLEGWADVQANMRRASDEFQTGFLTSSKETFREFVRTGELSLKRIGDLLVNTLADQVFENQLAPLLGQLGNGLARAIGLGGGTPRESQASAIAQRAVVQSADASSAAALATANAGNALTKATQDAADALARGAGSIAQFLAGSAQQLGSFVVQAARQLIAAVGASGGGGFLSGLVNSVAGYFTGGSASTSAVYSPQVPVSGTPLPPLSFGGGRAAGGSVGRGRYYEVLERDEPEVYETDGRKYLLNPSPGRVTPAMPLSRSERLAGSGAAAPAIINVKLIEGARTPSVEQKNNANGTVDLEIRIARLAEDAAARSVVDGGKVGRAMQSTFGLQRQGAVRR